MTPKETKDLEQDLAAVETYPYLCYSAAIRKAAFAYLENHQKEMEKTQ